MKRILFLCFVWVIIVSSCSSTQNTTKETTEPTEAAVTMELKSDAFASGQSIPAKYTCTGKNISPALMWSNAPAGTQSFALIVDDPDAPMGTWVHWVLYNIPSSTTSLPEATDANGISVGKNSSNHMSYDGPCPPSGTHRYFFKLYALDSTLSLSPGATKQQLLDAMKGHILAQGELMGTFSK
jgi:Raf kinase inhibitor-like YbhB/YbcL family protein